MSKNAFCTCNKLSHIYDLISTIDDQKEMLRSFCLSVNIKVTKRYEIYTEPFDEKLISVHACIRS
jgi:hypothetical protein